MKCDVCGDVMDREALEDHLEDHLIQITYDLATSMYMTKPFEKAES